MLKFLYNLYTNWSRIGFNVLLIASLVFIFAYWLFFTRTKDRGTYSEKKVSDWVKTFDNTYELKKKSKDSKGETESRRVLEKIFDKPFSKSRPKFLFNPATGKSLELDCFNLDMKLAVEYSGIQHYEFNKFFHNNNIENFRKQQERDRLKADVCKKLGVKLIVVPYTVKNEDIERFLRTELRKLGYKV